MGKDRQKTLLNIIKTWNINEKPEYRGFRCANCQKYLHKAWHYWCVNKDYKVPVHFCNKCESIFKLSKIKIVKPRTSINKAKFNLKLLDIEKRLKKIINRWNTKVKPTYKTFTCDSCAKNMHKAYHFWFKFKKCNILFETHFCKKCGSKLNLNSLK